MKRLIGMVVSALLLTAPALQAQDARTAPPDSESVQLTTVAEGFDRPIFVTGAGDGSGRLFVAEQVGRIFIVKDGTRLETPFLDITSLVNSNSSERGLLGLAFHPDYANNGLFFVHYSDANGDTAIARYHAEGDTADPDSAAIILWQQQPYANHNGGMIAFGPDGYLYIGLGDGGSGGDPHGFGQNLGTWLGKILRIDVNANTYIVPEDNPFVGTEGALPEIWAYGLRNPWRFSFDRETGDLYIGDVGQNRWEEINFQPGDSTGGENYGWNVYEAEHPFSGGAVSPDMVMPIAEYGHNMGISVTGGYVYRGSALPDLAGVYFYADYGTAQLWTLYRDADGQWQNNEFLSGAAGAISSFGEDDDGELYVVDYAGAILRFEPAS
jgi:glucose/arabinose dehydrogenase